MKFTSVETPGGEYVETCRLVLEARGCETNDAFGSVVLAMNEARRNSEVLCENPEML